MGVGGELVRSLLGTDDVFFLDSSSEVFVWVGKGASEREQKEGMAWALSYVRACKRPPSTRVRSHPSVKSSR